jgi:hypothetical protein
MRFSEVYMESFNKGCVDDALTEDLLVYHNNRCTEIYNMNFHKMKWLICSRW